MQLDQVAAMETKIFPTGVNTRSFTCEPVDIVHVAFVMYHGC